MALFKKSDGTFVDVPDSSVQSALEHGYTPATEADYEASKHPFEAGLEGAVEGATFGFGTPLLRNAEATSTGKTNEETAAGMRARAEQNPLASGVGKVAGVVGSSILTAGLADELGVVGAGAKVAWGAGEGTLNGLGSEVSEATLENRDVLPEKLAMNGLVGGLMGGSITAGFEGVKAGVNLAVGKLGASGLSKLFDPAEAEWSAISKGATANQLEKATPYKDAILKWARDNGVTGELTSAFDEIGAKKIEEGLMKSGQKIGAVIESLDKAAPLTDDARQAFAYDLQKQVYDKFGNASAHVEAVNKAMKQIDHMANSTATWKDLWAWQSNIFGSLEAGGASNNKAVMKAVREGIIDFASTAAEKVNPGQKAALFAARSEYRAGSQFQDFFEKRANAAAGMPSITDGLAEGAMYGHPVVGGIRALAKQQVALRGGLFRAALLDSLDSGSVNAMATGLRKRLETVLTAAPGLLGAARRGIENAMTQGDDALLAEHARLANGAGGDTYLASLGYSKETSEEMKAASARMAHLDALRAHGASVDARNTDAASAFFNGKPGRPGALKINQHELDAQLAHIRDVLRDPSKVFAELPPELAATAPGTMNAAAAAVLNGYRYLDAHAPKNPQAGLPPALQSPWTPSASEIDAWSRRVDAVVQPTKVLEDMSKGIMSKESIDALNAVYPKMYAEMKQKVFEAMQAYDKPVDYEKKLALGHIFGFSATGMRPEQFQMIQQSFNSAQGGNGQQGGGSVRKPDGRQKVDVEKNSQTQGQRMEAR